jgi:peptidoglycan/xylan/chitin deacetylase (PgdA/CDA1 family)
MRAVFTFHSIDDSGSVLSFPAALFDRFLTVLNALNIPVVDLNTLLSTEGEPGVVLTFDDGMQSVFSNALPIMKKHGVTAHVFITTKAVGTDRLWPDKAGGPLSFNMLSWDEIEQLKLAGISIDAHTQTHPNMRKIGLQQIEDECQGADEELKQRLGVLPEYFAYPFGFHNPVVRGYVRDRYKSAVTTELRYLGNNEDLAALPRVDSYYFQSPWLLQNMNSLPVKAYLNLRWLLRTFRGTHNTATCT